MSNTQLLESQVAPSVSILITGTLISVVVGVVIFVAFILPAEFGEDPLGTGALLGVKGLSTGGEAGEAPEGVLTTPEAFARSKDSAPRTERYSIYLAPGEDLEFKLLVGVNEPIHYTWSATGGRLTYDLHGEPLDGPEGFFQSYSLGDDSAGGAGWFLTPFGGTHGWYLHNKSDQLVTFSATVTGYFDDAE